MSTTLELDNVELQELEVGVTLHLARNYLLDFIITTKPDYDVVWFHEHLCHCIDKLISGEIKKMAVLLPPQHGKSEIVSRRLPAFLLGRFPSMKIACCSYSADRAAKLNREVQRIIDEESYQRIFPNTSLNSRNVVSDSQGSWLRNSSQFEVVGHGGSYKGVGVMGPLTGDPVDFGIIDDPIKDHVEAFSPTYRGRVWEWYLNVFLARLHNDSKQLLTVTRWHEDDLVGRILARESDWHVVTIPAIREDETNPNDPRQIGDALWPAKHSKEAIMAVKNNSERTFAALYQQRPAPLEGGIFKRHWWKFWEKLPPRVDKVILSWDCAFKDLKTSDYVVGLVLAKLGADTFIVDMVRGKWDFPETVKRIREMHFMYPMASDKLIEEKANGAAVIQVLRKEIPGLIPIIPTESKESRAYAVTSVVEGGNVYLPAFAPWRDTMLYELSVFPNGVNDDIVDALTQALRRLYVNTNQTARLFHMAGAQ